MTVIELFGNQLLDEMPTGAPGETVDADSVPLGGVLLAPGMNTLVLVVDDVEVDVARVVDDVEATVVAVVLDDELVVDVPGVIGPTALLSGARSVSFVVSLEFSGFGSYVICAAQLKLDGEPTHDAGTEAVYVLLANDSVVLAHVTNCCVLKLKTLTAGPLAVPPKMMPKSAAVVPPVSSAQSMSVGLPCFQLADVLGSSNCVTCALPEIVPSAA